MSKMFEGRGVKKGATAPMRREVHWYLDSLSKAALLDIVLDAAALASNDACGEEVTLEQIDEYCTPRLLVRGDPSPKKRVEKGMKQVEERARERSLQTSTRETGSKEP